MEEDKKKIEEPEIKDEQAKKKKKKSKNKKKKTTQVPNETVHKEEEEAEIDDKQETSHAENHEDLLKLLSQNDNTLFEKLLQATPDFTNFDQINKRLQDQIQRMDANIHEILSGNFEKIPDEEENYGFKGMPDEKSIEPKRRSAMKELQEKIDYFKEKIQNLDNLQNLPSDELSNEERQIINLIRTNLLDDVKRAEDFMLVIANTDSYVLKH